MPENRFPTMTTGNPRETVCIDTNRVCDSCRDRDCFENVRVYLSEFGHEILERTGAIRPKSAEILWTHVTLDEVPFNRGFYAVNTRFYIRILCEACTGSTRSQDVEGLCILDKKVILYGGEGNANIFRSGSDNSFCAGLPDEDDLGVRNAPTAIVEVVDPIVLGAKIVDVMPPCPCCCQDGNLPRAVTAGLQATPRFDDNGLRFLTVSLGMFSVVRVVRPGQYLVQASEYIVPEKECVPMEEDDPCSVFRNMPFPSGEFGSGTTERQGRSCGCGGN